MKIIKNVFICMLLIFSLTFSLNFNVYAEEVDKPDISSPSVLLMDLSSGKVLFEKNMNDKRYPASLTKIMTAILTLENCNLDEVTTVSSNAVMSLSSGYVTANLQVGEELTVDQLLHVLMVGSSNDAAIVLAEHISGSVEEFSKLMNEKATEIGCTFTHFVNPNGTHDTDHYSTTYDLALIAKYAMQNQTFRQIVSTTSYQLPATDKYKNNDRLFTTTNSLLIVNNNNRADNYYYKYATGIKTGFTTPAGNCLIASANKDGLELLTVVLGAGDTKSGLSARYIDTINLFEYGYDTYTLIEVVKSGGVVQTVNIDNATRDTKRLEAVVENDVFVLVKQSDKDSPVIPEVKLNEGLKAPIKKGDIIGTVKYTVEGIDYEENLIAKNDVKSSKVFINFIFIVIIIIFVFLYFRSNKKFNKKVKNKKRIK